MLHKNTLEYLVFFFFFQNKVLTRKGKLLVYIIIQVLIPTSHFGYKMQPLNNGKLALIIILFYLDLLNRCSSPTS